MPIEVMREAISKVPHLGFLSVIGAEPLADWDLTITALTKARRCLGAGVGLSVTTGGWPGFKREQALQLRALGATVVASVDGPTWLHNAQRNNSYAAALDMLRVLRGARVVVTRLRATLDPALWGPPPVLDCAQHLDDLCRRGLARGYAVEVAVNRVPKGWDPSGAVAAAAAWYGRCGKAPWHAVESHRARLKAGAAFDPRPRCGAMRSMVAVDPEGGLWPCHRMPPGGTVGTVSGGIDRASAAAWWDRVLRTREPCMACPHWVLCRGGCPAEDGPDGPLPASCAWRGAVVTAARSLEKRA
jgi:radical SAM protein with 4Fe4S-binding SPASM domain